MILGFLKTLAILLLIMYTWRFIRRIWYIEKSKKNNQQQFRQKSDVEPRKKYNYDSDFGEYVDYEEVDDE